MGFGKNICIGGLRCTLYHAVPIQCSQICSISLIFIVHFVWVMCPFCERPPISVISHTNLQKPCRARRFLIAAFTMTHRLLYERLLYFSEIRPLQNLHPLFPNAADGSQRAPQIPLL